MSIRRRAAGAALALAVGSAGAILIAVPASAAPPSGNAAHECQAFREEFGLPPNFVGACVSLVRSRTTSSAVFVFRCRNEFVPEGFFATVGECVSELNRGLR